MALQRCSLCFQLREPSKRDPLPGVAVCGRCAMDLERVLGFLAAQGHGIALDLFGTTRVLDLNTGEVIDAAPLLQHAAAPPKPPNAARRGSAEGEPKGQPVQDP